MKNVLLTGLIFLSLFSGIFRGVDFSDVPYITRMTKAVYSEKEKSDILEKVKSSTIIADVFYQVKVYETREDDESKITGELHAGVSVEILEDYSTEKYLIHESLTGIVGWVDADALMIPKDTVSDKSRMSQEELEGYVNLKNLKSDSKYLVFTDIGRQLVHAYTGYDRNWKLLRSFPCASGKNISPTTRGIFKISTRGDWFYSERLNSGAKYWIRFNGSYLFHSLPMDRFGVVMDDNIGERNSNGCVRLLIPDIEWLYDNVPDTTTVFIY